MAWSYTIAELAQTIDARVPRDLPTDVLDRSFSGVSTDTRTLAPGQAFFALSGEHFDGNRFVPGAFEKGAAVAVTTAEAPGPCLVVEDTLAALQRFAASHRRRFTAPLFALTGSCGKTTAKDFCAALLATRYEVVKTRGNLNNEIGCPLSLLQLDRETGIAVIEMGANHAGEIARLCELAQPTESAVTMVAPAHLEGFGSIENVAAAKGEIAEALPPDGCFYVNTDDPWCVRIAERHRGPAVRFGSGGEVALRSCGFDGRGEMLLDVDPVGRLCLPLAVRAHTTNVLLAVAVALRHGVTDFEEPLRVACAAATRFRVKQLGPVEVLDDTYNANPASMEAALEALAARPGTGKRVAALGEMLELGAAARGLHEQVGEAAARHGVTHLFVRGENARALVAAAAANGVSCAEVISEHTAMAEAIAAVACGGDAVLLKGSRGMRMEKVLDALESIYDGKET